MDLRNSAVFCAMLVFIPVVELKFYHNPYDTCLPYVYKVKPYMHVGLSCLQREWSTIPPARRDALRFLQLQIHYSKIARVPLGAFDDFANLTQIDLTDNQIKWIHVGAFHKLTKLTEIYLGRNQLRRLAPGTLEGLTNLVFLSLADNKLRVIEHGLLEGAPALEGLLLQKNELEFISEDEIAGLPHLRIFYVDNQRSRGKLSLSYKMFSNIINNAQHKRVDIRIGDNSYDCRCNMAWLIYYLHSRQLPDKKKVTGLFKNLKNVTCSSTNARGEYFFLEYFRKCCSEMQYAVESTGLQSCDDLNQ